MSHLVTILCVASNLGLTAAVVILWRQRTYYRTRCTLLEQWDATHDEEVRNKLLGL